MGLIDRARNAVKRYTSDVTGAAVSITIKNPNNSVSLDLTGIHTRINLGVDQDGNITNSRKAYVSIMESFLVSNGYPVRNSERVIILKGHQIIVSDTFGISNYVIKTVIPDDTLGNLVCMLSDLEDAT